MSSPADLILISLALGALNLVLAAMIGGVRPRRLPNLVAAALIGANGIISILAAYGSYRDNYDFPGASNSPFLIRSIIGFNVMTTVAFIAFPFLFPRPLLSASRQRLFLVLCGGLLMFNWILLFIPGPSFVNDFSDPILRYTIFFPFFAGIVAGTFLLLDAYLSTPSLTLRTQSLFILAAYVMKCSSYVMALWQSAYDGSVAFETLAQTERLIATAALATAVLAVPVALLSSRLRGSAARAGPRPFRHEILLLACACIGLIGLNGVLLNVFNALEYLMFRPILFAYGILQFQLLQVDLRARKGIVTSAILVIMATVFLVVSDRTQYLGVSAPVAVGLGLLSTVAAGSLLLLPLIKALFSPGGPAPDPRGHELYRAALEQAVAAGEGHSTTNHRILATLRSRLQISAREHALMETSVRSLFGRGSDGPIVGQTFLGRYRVERVLGEGGFGRTFLARDTQMGRLVALKAARISSAEETKRALKEARLVARLRHPNIVAIHDVEEVAGDLILILEYVEGGSLAEKLRKGRLRPEESYPLVDDVLAGLEAAHAGDIVHRDLKPENILLTAEGRAKLADFGVARGEAGTGTMTSLSVAGTHPGSLHYMSPEQVRGQPLDARSDLYSLAVVWYEALAGQSYLNFRGRAEFDARLAILDERPRLPISGIPDAVNALLARLLSKDPRKRPASASALRDEISRIVASGTVFPVARRRSGIQKRVVPDIS